MTIEVSAVRGPRDYRSFINLPYRLHAGTIWVPPPKEERMLFLVRRLNAFFTHGEAEYFLARREGRVVGRITAHVDFAYNRYHGSARGMFGFLEFENDREVVDAMLKTVTHWLRARGLREMVGPMDFTVNEDAGILIEGYESEPMVRQPWHPPYYRQLLEAAGLEKQIDLLSWDLNISDRRTMDPRLERIAVRARERHGVTIRRMSRRSLRRDLDEFALVYNAAWSRSWGYVPYTKADLDAFWFELQLIFSRDWFMVAEIDGKTVGMAITIPDVAQLYRRMRGHLLPVGWIWWVLRWHIMDRIRIGFLGVLPEYEHTGVGAALYLEHFDTAARVKQDHGEAGFTREDASSINRSLEAMGGRVVKRWRVYGSTL